MSIIPPSRILEWRVSEYAGARRETAALTKYDLSRETEALGELAAAIARSVGEWQATLRPIELARPMDLRRAGDIVIETVFDDLLEPAAWRLLAAGFALAEFPS